MGVVGPDPVFLCETCDVGWEHSWCPDCGQPMSRQKFVTLSGGAWRFDPNTTTPVTVGYTSVRMKLPPPGELHPYP